jgi:gluconate 2-dehydrogenase alpha chain
VLRVELTPDRKRATGVTYVNSAGEEFFQPAEMVILSAYILQNVRLLLLSGIGKPYDPKTGEGVVGKNYAYQTMSSVNVFFDDKIINPFIGAGALATVIDDFNGDNFDHSGLGFIGGAYIAGMVTGGRPIEMIYTPQGTRRWGLEWKHAAAKNYLRSFSLSIHGSCMSASRQLPGPRSHLPRHPRPADAAHDIRFHRQRSQDVGLPDRSRRRGGTAMNPREIKLNRRTGPGAWCPTRPRTTPAARSWATTPGTASSTNICSLGRAQCVLDGRRRLSAERRLQPDRHPGGARLYVGRCHQVPVPEGSGPAGARLIPWVA